MSRTKAIKLKCLDCCAGQRSLVKECPSKDCPLWDYRLGKKMLENQGFSETKPEVGNSILETSILSETSGKCGVNDG